MIFNTVVRPYHWSCKCSFEVSWYPLYLIQKYDFFSFLQNEGIFAATLDVKEEGVGVSDYNVILMLSMATLVWMSPLR